MIKEKELLDAIAECQGQRNPNANTCLKLASFYTILDHIQEKEVPAYSYAAPPSYESETEFGIKIRGKNTEEVMVVIDELMSTLSIVNPRLYNAVMSRL